MSLENKENFPLMAEAAKVLAALDNLQLAWLSGYAWAKANGAASGQISAKIDESHSVVAVAEPLAVTIISASQTGNAKGVAAKLAARLQAEGIQAQLFSAKDYKAKNIGEEKTLIIVSSTQGEGEAPEEAMVLYKFLHGKKAPKLDRLQFAVLGLGDSSYPNFCQAGKDFDAQLAQLGASRLLERTDADLEF